MDKLNDTAKTTVRIGFHLFLGHTLSTIILAVTSIVVARLLDPENYGLYTLALVAPMVLANLSDLGISPALTKFSASLHADGKDGEVMDLIKTGLIFKLVFSLPLALLLFLLSDSIAIHFFNRPSVAPLIRLTPLLLVCQAVYSAVSSAFLGLDEVAKVNLIMGVQALTKAGTSILLVILGFGAAGATGGAVLGLMVASMTGIIVLVLRTTRNMHQHHPKTRIGFGSRLKLLVSYGLPLNFTTILHSLLIQYQFWVVALFASDAEVGNYRVTTNFSALMTIIIFPIANTLFPAFSKLNIKENYDSLKRMFRYAVKYASFLVIPVALTVTVLSNEIIYLLYGVKYQLASGYLTLYVLSFLFVGLGRFVIDRLFNGQGDTKATCSIELVLCAIFFPLAPLLTFLYGVFGLIIATLIADSIMILYALYLVHQRYAMNIDVASSFRILGASLSSTVLVFIFQRFIPLPHPFFRLVVLGFIFFISFLFFSPLLGAVTEADLQNLDRLTKDIAPIYLIVKLILSVEKRIITLLHS